jgi:predicted nucleotide-binding protein
MNKPELLERLQTFHDRLLNDVVPAYADRGTSFGKERFASWRRQFTKFLDEKLPGTSSKLDAKLHKMAYFRGRSESDLAVFVREDGDPCIAFIESLKLDIDNDEFEVDPPPKQVPKMKQATANKSVFIVHGHDELTKTKTARFIERLGYKAIILHEQASQGMTIIEKIEAHTEVGFAIVLYTADDVGNTGEAGKRGELKNRARQNVVFEHGYLMAKLTRARVIPLVSGNVELPSDISGIVYVDDSNWQIEIAKEMKSAGFSINFNKIVES